MYSRNMCGIAGILGWQASPEKWKRTLVDMGSTLAHRGPDGAGTWFDASKNIGLSHRRLSVIDLSEQAHQPMQLSSARWTIVFNGEIYNFRELRSELEKKSHIFRTSSDTEVILALLDIYDIELTLQKLSGMFAIAAWDAKENRLILARDRFGEKPLYYGMIGKTLVFASELKAILKFDGARSESVIDRDSVDLFLSLSYIPQPKSIYKNIYKLPPAHFLSINSSDQVGRPKPYWDLRKTFHAAKAAPFTGSIEDAAESLEEQMSQIVARQMISDVPLGAFLSGGVDSSTVVGLMTQHSRNVRTFTMQFDAPRFDESQEAEAVARHLGTKHETMLVGINDSKKLIPEICRIYDEPFSDISQIPTILLSRMTRKHVTVALSGDGGDEVFGGYNRYQFAEKHWPIISHFPKQIRRSLAGALLSCGPERWESLAKLVWGSKTPHRLFGDKVHKFARVLDSRDADTAYARLTQKLEPFHLPARRFYEGTIPEQWMIYDLENYLPGDCLTKVDRASMSASLETRTPFLDHELVAFAFSLPSNFKVTPGSNKRVLRNLATKFVPPKSLNRPKMGFAVPIGQWLRDDLREWAGAKINAIQSSPSLASHHEFASKLWQEHLAGRRDHGDLLWSFLVLQSWLEP